MGYRYVVLGSGRQGTAAAYDMVVWGDAKRVLIADANAEIARQSAERINRMTESHIVDAVQIDVSNTQELERLFDSADACLSAVPYYFNLPITEIALKTNTNFCDLGGNLEIARKQQEFNVQAQEIGVSIIPNCGQVPGMGTTLMVRAVELLDEAIDVFMWDGGLPVDPKPPFRYMATFHIAGLTNEYAEPGIFLRHGKVTEVEPISELETIIFPDPIGPLEAFVTGGGTDTMPYTYQGKLRTLQNKTLRYPGSFSQLRAFYDLGLWRLDPIKVGNVSVVPRDVFHTLFAPLVRFTNERDVCLIRIKAIGKKNGSDAESHIELIDYFDEKTGFSAMERCTGWSAAIVAEMMAKGMTPHGAGGVESMVPPAEFIQQLKRRGIVVSESVTQI